MEAAIQADPSGIVGKAAAGALNTAKEEAKARYRSLGHQSLLLMFFVDPCNVEMGVSSHSLSTCSNVQGRQESVRQDVWQIAGHHGIMLDSTCQRVQLDQKSSLNWSSRLR